MSSPAIRKLIVLVMGVLLSVSVSLSCRPHDKQGNRSAKAVQVTTEARSSVAALARLEPRGGTIDVGGMAGERLEKLLVVEGELVTAGQEMALLGSYSLRQSEKDLAEIQLNEAKMRGAAERAYAEAVVAEAEAAFEELKLADLDVQALASKIDALELNLEIANRDRERLTGAGEAVSAQEQDHQRLLVEQAKAELQSARAQKAKLEATREAREREGRAKLQTAQANLARVKSSTQSESLEKAVATAAQKLELAVVRAPQAGRVLKIVTHVGETVGPRPILRLGDTEHMYATAEIYETDVRLVRQGQMARITSEALPAPLTGTVESIGTMISKNEVVSLDPTAAADARVLLARIRLDDSSEAAKMVDLQVDVLIDTETPPSAVQSQQPGS